MMHFEFDLKALYLPPSKLFISVFRRHFINHFFLLIVIESLIIVVINECVRLYLCASFHFSVILSECVCVLLLCLNSSLPSCTAFLGNNIYCLGAKLLFEVLFLN